TQPSRPPLRAQMFIGPPLQALRLGRREKVCATKFQYSDGDCECSNLSAPAPGPGRNGHTWIGSAACRIFRILILWFGSQLHGWKLWLAISTSVLFAMWAGATIGAFFGG